MQRTRAKRLPPEIFDLPVEKMREGYYTDAYFNHTRSALLADGRHPQHPVARALARPGHELQHRLATADPDPAQLEVAEAALQACLELEGNAG